MYYKSSKFWSQLKMLTSPVLDSPTTYYYKIESKAKIGLNVRLKRVQNATHFNLLLFPQFVISTWNRKLKVRHEMDLMDFEAIAKSQKWISPDKRHHIFKWGLMSDLNTPWKSWGVKFLRGHPKSMFVQDSRVFTSPPPLFVLVARSFLGTPSPSPKVRSFWLELTLSPSISIYLWNLEFKFKLIMSTSWTQRVFYEATVESL